MGTPVYSAGGMTVGIDYDDTWTAAPELFAEFVRMLQAAGHTAIIVTGRSEERRPEGLPIPVYCTGGRAKRWFMLDEHGIHVDIWIDDTPEWVGQDA